MPKLEEARRYFRGEDTEWKDEVESAKSIFPKWTAKWISDRISGSPATSQRWAEAFASPSPKNANLARFATIIMDDITDDIELTANRIKAARPHCCKTIVEADGSLPSSKWAFTYEI